MVTEYTLVNALFVGFEIQIFNTFGNAFPVQYWSRLWISIYVMVALGIQSQQLMAIVVEYRGMNDYRYRPEMTDHFIICGKLNPNVVWRLLNEYVEYHNEFEKKTEMPSILIIQDCLPSDEMIALVSKFQSDEIDLQYLRIELNEKELKIFGTMDLAQRIYYLNDSQDPKLWFDYEVFMIMKTIENLNPMALKVFQINIAIPTQTLKMEVKASSNVNILSWPYLKAKLFSNSAFTPGINCVIQNLLLSISDFPQVKKVMDIPWILDYMQGAQLETFVVKFSAYFVFKKFADVAHDLYFSRAKNKASSTVILVGIKSFNAASQHGTILINPYQYIIQAGDYAVLMANNIEDALLVEDYEERVSLQFTGTIHKRPLLKRSKEMASWVRAMAICQKENTSFMCQLEDTFYKIWMGDGVVGKVNGHIIVTGPSIYLPIVCEYIRKRTNKPICYCSRADPDKYFEIQVKRYQNIFYFQCDILNTIDLFKIGMKDAYH